MKWVRPKLHLLNVEYDPWKIDFSITWKIKDISTLESWLNSLQHWILEKLLDRRDTKECKKFQLFVHSLQQTTRKIQKTQF